MGLVKTQILLPQSLKCWAVLEDRGHRANGSVDDTNSLSLSLAWRDITEPALGSQSEEDRVSGLASTT